MLLTLRGSREGSLVNRVKDTNKIQKNITLIMKSRVGIDYTEPKVDTLVICPYLPHF